MLVDPNTAESNSASYTIIFCLAYASCIEVKLIGTLYLSEIITLALFPVLVQKHGHALKNPLPRRLIIMFGIWFFGQLVTDIIRSTPFHDLARGWSKIAFFFINFCIIYLLIANNRKAIFIFGFGLVLGSLTWLVVSPSEFAVSHPWKFGLAVPLTLLVGLISLKDKQMPGEPPVSIFLMGGICLVHLALNARSMGMICFLVTMYLLMARYFIRTKPNTLKLGATRIIKALLVLVIAYVGVDKGYSFLIDNKLLNAEAIQKYEEQSGAFGVLVGGRFELVVGAIAISDSPIIGHGSWAKNPKYMDLLFSYRRDLGYSVGGSAKSDLIPSHSHLLGAWVEAGILGAFFWFWVIGMILRLLFTELQTPDILKPFTVIVCILFLWDIVFSPFGANRRIFNAYYIVVLFSSLGNIESYIAAFNARWNYPLSGNAYS